MSKKYVITQTFKINKSVLLMRWLVVLHVVAIFSSFMNALALNYKIIVALLILVSLTVYLKREINFHGISIRQSMGFGWEISESENNFYPIEILASTVITHYLIGLHLKLQNQKKMTILICKDALIDDEFRKLKVALKISALKKGR